MTVNYELLAACRKAATSLTDPALDQADREIALAVLKQNGSEICGATEKKPLIHLVKQFYRLGQFPEAIAIAEAALSDAPKDLDVLRVLRTACIHAGMSEKAADVEAILRKINPDETFVQPKNIDSQIITNTYLVAIEEKNYGKATQTLINLYTKKQSSGSLAASLANLFEITERAAVRQLISTLKMKARNAPNLFILGCAYRFFEQKEPAIAVLEQAHKIAPRTIAIADTLYATYDKASDWKKKDGLAVLLHRLDPAHDTYAMNLASLHLRNKAPDKAIRVLQPFVHTDSDTAKPNIKLLEMLCHIHLDQHALDKAAAVIDALPRGKGLGVRMLSAFLQRQDILARTLAVDILRDKKQHIKALTVLKITHNQKGMSGREFDSFCRSKKLSVPVIKEIEKTEQDLTRMRSPLVNSMTAEDGKVGISRVYRDSNRVPVDKRTARLVS